MALNVMIMGNYELGCGSQGSWSIRRKCDSIVWKMRNSLSCYPISFPRFEPLCSKRGSRNTNHSAAMFGRKLIPRRKEDTSRLSRFTHSCRRIEGCPPRHHCFPNTCEGRGATSCYGFQSIQLLCQDYRKEKSLDECHSQNAIQCLSHESLNTHFKPFFVPVNHFYRRYLMFYFLYFVDRASPYDSC